MKIAIAGATGRMGQALIRKALSTPGVELVGGGVRPKSKAQGEEAGSLVGLSSRGALLTPDMDALVKKADAVIDFTQGVHSLEIAELAAKYGKIHVCGTTGMDEAEVAALKKYAKKARIIYSRNMSVGVNLLLGLVEKVAATLPAGEFDIEIDEMHHRFKVDAPSGTALMLGEAAAKGRNVSLEKVKNIYGFDTPDAREVGSIGFSVRRGGDVVGDHSVVFAGAGERIEISHKSNSRDIYAAGAIRAALWAKDKKPGFYTMKDVLGL